MNKEFVTYEQALALKELGFDEECLGWYNPQVNYKKTTTDKYWAFYLSGEWEEFKPAPLKQQVFRWFTEKHDIQYWLHDGGYLGKCFIKITGYKHDKFYFSSSEPMNYEEAEHACIDKLIELIKTK